MDAYFSDEGQDSYEDFMFFRKAFMYNTVLPKIEWGYLVILDKRCWWSSGISESANLVVTGAETHWVSRYSEIQLACPKPSVGDCFLIGWMRVKTQDELHFRLIKCLPIMLFRNNSFSKKIWAK